MPPELDSDPSSAVKEYLDAEKLKPVLIGTMGNVEEGKTAQPAELAAAQRAEREATGKPLSRAQLWQTVDTTLQQAENDSTYLLGKNSKLRERRRTALHAFLEENASFAQIGERTGLTLEGARENVQRGLELVFSSLPEEITRGFPSAEALYKQLVQAEDNSQIQIQRIKDGIARSKASGRERKPREKETQPRKKYKHYKRKKETQPRKKSETRSQSVAAANRRRWEQWRAEGKPQGTPAFSEQGLANIRASKQRQKELKQNIIMQSEQTLVDFTQPQTQPPKKPQE